MAIYYVGTGEKCMMFTLRCQSEETMVVDGINVKFICDYYIRNLSIDQTRAVDTAAMLGYEVSKPQFSLQEIQRSEERISAAQREFRLAELMAREYELRLAREVKIFGKIEDGIWPFGRYANQAFHQADSGYIAYWLKGASEADDRIVSTLRQVLAMKFPDVVRAVMLGNGNGEFFGEIKTRYKSLSGVVTAFFCYETFYGWMNILKIVLDTGELLMYRGASSFPVDVGCRIKFDMTVKDHTEYESVNQTEILRIKLIEE